MDCNSGRLVADLDQVPAEQRHHFTPVPRHLQAEAQRRLAGQHEVIVSPQEESRLAAWAAQKRDKNRKKNKLSRQSRKAARK